MARWEPNARERLARAALDLFVEQGYDATTVQQIADRVGLTKMTFFRHFPDKREVLFAGQETHVRVLAEAIVAAPVGATPMEAIHTGLKRLAALFTDTNRAMGAQLHQVIAANAELLERAAFKRAILVQATTAALAERGVREPTAGLAAELGIGAFYRAFGQWAELTHQATLAELTHQALDELVAAAAGLVADSRPADGSSAAPPTA
ncbi:TetR/AcrR family transcriptional regulator [Nocardia sp. NPDC059246]|uniref:TetR/AcrR family transcriptional regulator n=1 Tax=unclassified Nocardia TaxID=2637762 RepID=UPI0036779AF1